MEQGVIEAKTNTLGAYLKDRRAKVKPATTKRQFTGRRRTPGLRREEVAERADVSVTWYTRLEQGRGGRPSAEMLDRLARALELGEVEREHLYLLAQGRLPDVEMSTLTVSVSPRLQRVLDTFGSSPALVKDAAWNVLAWNEAAAATLIDYATLPSQERNVLRLVFSHPLVRGKMPDWESTARFVVGTFRESLVRAGATQQAQALIDDLSLESSEFRAMWLDQNVCKHMEGVKQISSPQGDLIKLEYLSFAVEGHAGLSMVVYTPSTIGDTKLVEKCIGRRRVVASRLGIC